MPLLDATQRTETALAVQRIFSRENDELPPVSKADQTTIVGLVDDALDDVEAAIHAAMVAARPAVAAWFVANQTLGRKLIEIVARARMERL